MEEPQTSLHDAVRQVRAAGTEPHVMVPDFHDVPLQLRWKRHASSLTDALRGSVLRDADLHVTRKEHTRATDTNEMLERAANDDQFIDVVQMFLLRRAKMGL